MVGYEEMKVVVLGAQGVGKSAITVQFINGVFVERYDPTIEDSYRKMVEVEGITFMLEILDTAFTGSFVEMRNLYLKMGEVFLIVYSVASRASLDSVHADNADVRQAHGVNGDVTIVVMGNKCDLDANQRQVTEEEGRQVASSIGASGFFETSAKRRVNVDEAFQAAVKDAWEKRKMREGEAKQKKKRKQVKNGEQGSSSGSGSGSSRSCILS